MTGAKYSRIRNPPSGSSSSSKAFRQHERIIMVSSTSEGEALPMSSAMLRAWSEYTILAATRRAYLLYRGLSSSLMPNPRAALKKSFSFQRKPDEPSWFRIAREISRA